MLLFSGNSCSVVSGYPDTTAVHRRGEYCYQFVHKEKYWTSARDYCREVSTMYAVFEIPAGPLAHRQQLFSRACNFENLLVRWASNFFQAFFPSHHTYCRLSQVYGLLVLTGTFDRKQQQPNLFSTKKITQRTRYQTWPH